MKKIMIILGLVTILSACGKKDGGTISTEVTGNDPLSTVSIDSFVGVYDLIRMDSDDCGASVRIVKVCDGIQTRSNNLVNQSYCNINKGEIKTGDNRSSTTVTLESNVLKSVALIFDERSTPPGNVKQVVTNTLTLAADGNLLKQSDKSSCLYQKR